jgi:RNA polymerase sigma-70 factor (ECF subfamily)
MRYRSNEPDDGEAVRRVLAGERETFALLLRRHHASTLRICRSILGSEAEARDVAQEATLQSFLGLGRLREPGQFGVWMHSIAANLARTALRRRRMLSLESLGERRRPDASWADAAPTPEEVRLARELHDEVLKALGGLSAVNREAVIGYYLEGHSYAELAELLNVPVSTIKGRLHKGRRQLAPTLAPVAREILGPGRKERVAVETNEMVEVVVDDVRKGAVNDESKLEWLREAGSLNDLIGRSEDGAPLPGGLVVLRETGGERVLPIWIGLSEALNIWNFVSGRQMSPPVRPMTYDLMRQMLETLGLSVQSVAVNRLAESTFYGDRTYAGKEPGTVGA